MEKSLQNLKLNLLVYILKKFDNLKIRDQVCFIKIDVEGLDHLVLYGMKKCIEKFLPVILVEYNYSNFSMIYKIFKKI